MSFAFNRFSNKPLLEKFSKEEKKCIKGDFGLMDQEIKNFTLILKIQRKCLFLFK